MFLYWWVYFSNIGSRLIFLKWKFRTNYTLKVTQQASRGTWHISQFYPSWTPITESTLCWIRLWCMCTVCSSYHIHWKPNVQKAWSFWVQFWCLVPLPLYNYSCQLSSSEYLVAKRFCRQIILLPNDLVAKLFYCQIILPPNYFTAKLFCRQITLLPFIEMRDPAATDVLTIISNLAQQWYFEIKTR